MPNLFNPDYLGGLCRRYGLQPSRKYGQNYLIDADVIQKIVAAGKLTETDTVVEVGPGFGTLTFALIQRTKKVVAFEIEKKLQPYWDEKIKEYPNIGIVWGNVLKEFARQNFSNYKVVANLPYQITSPVIRLFLEAENPPSELILMVQKEVGERLSAVPGQLSLLAVAVQYYADVKYLFTVPRTSFWPVPAVDSCVVQITLKKLMEEEKITAAYFFKVVKIGFAQKRKLLIKNLLPLVGRKNKVGLEKIFDLLQLKVTTRAQELTLEQWKKLATEVNLLIQTGTER